MYNTGIKDVSINGVNIPVNKCAVDFGVNYVVERSITTHELYFFFPELYIEVVEHLKGCIEEHSV